MFYTSTDTGMRICRAEEHNKEQVSHRCEMNTMCKATFYLAVFCSLFSVAKTGTPADIDPQVSNGGFESTTITSMQYVTSVTGWTLSGTAILIPDGSLDWGGLSSDYGVNYLGLQGTGSYIEQTVTGLIDTRTYWVSVTIAVRPGNEGGKVALYIDGTQRWSKESSTTAFSVEGNNAFTASGTSVVIKVTNDSPAGDYTVFVDNIIISDGNPKVLNGDFEAQDDIDPCGKYFVALQDTDDYFEQYVHGLSPVGTYTLSFLYAARPIAIECQTCLSGARLALKIDDIQVWAAFPSSTGFITKEFTFTATKTYVKLRWENVSPVTAKLDNDKAVFIDNIVLPGTLLAADYDFETGGVEGCAVTGLAGNTSLAGQTWSGSLCIFKNGVTNSDGCNFDSYSGETYISLETPNTYVEQQVTPHTATDVIETWIITWRYAACKTPAKLGLYIFFDNFDRTLVWSGDVPNTGFVTGNYIWNVLGTTRRRPWTVRFENLSPGSDTEVYLDFITFVKAVSPPPSPPPPPPPLTRVGLAASPPPRPLGHLRPPRL
ncbi:hypothetical protein CYMTET_15426 [Cymbomonas tetramitiformis]|uniref:Uncharacterized protein n=1 Tax=Cymbomonas tetramitiformis TaxID=36881 RepID=A0AAE0GEH7_9CHLO|nr:hypothetical protein CYMTET_15426 [Cymbomonas tetramitiformis]